MKAKLQQNDEVNVIVSTEKSNNRVIWHENIDVTIVKLTDDEIIAAYKKHYGQPSISDMKDKLKKINIDSDNGYAILNTSDDHFNRGDLVGYQRVGK